MKLSQLIEKINYDFINGNADIPINHLVYDSRKVTDGDVFVCIVGAKTDGHQYLDEVIHQGAAAVVVERMPEMKPEYEKVTFIRTDNNRLALAQMSAAYFDYPAEKLFTIGITGTKGKTTTTFMVREILEQCGIKTGLIGTIETIIGDMHIPSANTTPESYQVQEYFAKMVEAGCKCAVMEVSSQALKLDRTAGILFDIGVFTNLEPDHIGPNEHSSFEEYLACKGLLFRQCKVGIVNSDDEHAKQVLAGHTCTVETYGITGEAMLRAENIIYRHEGGQITTSYDVTGKKQMHIVLTLPGEFSVYNSLCAIAITGHFQIEEKRLKEALYQVKVAGRVEPVSVSDDFIVMIDYAHNAMSLKSLLSTLREYEPGRLITVFGCGGNRSKDRRFEMGEVSGKMSDLTIITSDNPRDEDPEAIIDDIESSLKKTGGDYVRIADRGEAVKYAIAHGQPGDMIVIAGKGHEDYQEIKGVKYHQTDRELILKAVEEQN